MYAKHASLTYLILPPLVFCLQLFLILTPKMRYSKDFVGSFEGVRGKKPQVTLDVMSNSPFLYKEVNSNLPRETCSLSYIT